MATASVVPIVASEYDSNSIASVVVDHYLSLFEAEQHEQVVKEWRMGDIQSCSKSTCCSKSQMALSTETRRSCLLWMNDGCDNTWHMQGAVTP